MSRTKGAAVQRFPDALVSEWLRIPQDQEICELLGPVLRPQSPASQLKAAKKMGSVLEQDDEGSVCTRLLVEIHSSCASRHPLQRTISSMLLKVQREPLEQMITANLRRVLYQQLVLGDQEREEGRGSLRPN